MIEKHETFYSKEEAYACQTQHADAQIIFKEGHGMMLCGEWMYVIPEDRPSWTVYWEENLNRYFYTFGSNSGYPYQSGWVEIHATSREEAARKFHTRFPNRPEQEGTMSYDEEEWAKMDPKHTWPSWKLLEIIE